MFLFPDYRPPCSSSSFSIILKILLQLYKSSIKKKMKSNINYERNRPLINSVREKMLHYFWQSIFWQIALKTALMVRWWMVVINHCYHSMSKKGFFVRSVYFGNAILNSDHWNILQNFWSKVINDLLTYFSINVISVLYIRFNIIVFFSYFEKEKKIFIILFRFEFLIYMTIIHW